MNSSFFNMLHYSADNDGPIFIAHGIDIEFESIFQESVNQDRMAWADAASVRHVFRNCFRPITNFHCAPTQNITRTDENRVTDLHGNPDRLIRFESCAIRRTFDFQPVDEFAESFAVLGNVDHIGGCTEYWNACRFKLLCKLERGLPTESNDYAIRLFKVYDVHHIFESERLEVKLVASVVIGRDGFGIAIYHYCLDTFFFKRERGMYAAIIELDSLADSVRSTAKYHNFFLVGSDRLVFLFISRVVIRRLGGKLSSAGIYGLKYRHNSKLFPACANIVLAHAEN